KLMKRRDSRYRKLGSEMEGKQKRRGFKKIQVRGSNRISWAVGAQRRVKVASPVYLLKSVKETYSAMFSLATGRNPIQNICDNGACRPVLYE
ncbi:hypothetical protein KI387_021826, partial [Taxus chinensis]